MLDRRGDQMPGFLVVGGDDPKNGEIIGLRAAAGEYDLLRLGANPFRDLPTRVVQPFPRHLPEMVDTGSVAVHFGHHRKYGVQDLRRYRRRRVVIEVKSLQKVPLQFYQ